ncbi:unnamed protein product [Fructobacillus cardui]|uniref:hypothetical protein n=1 Tax=Fructobacillus cardui TaxID=2893170 RepID=UPI002D8EFB22|nr:unnamed protein product [Fructobacillus cardui]
MKELLSNNEDLKKLSKEERENLNKKINNYDNLILKAWILKKTSAEEAHFLLGVATSDKRVVGAYDINRESIHINPDNNRIEFQINDVNNRKYLEGITSAYSEKKPSLPGIEDWKATNPVLLVCQ